MISLEFAIIVMLVVVLIYCCRKSPAGENLTVSPYGNISMRDADLLGMQHEAGATAMFDVPTSVNITRTPSGTKITATQIHDNSDVIAQLFSPEGPNAFLPNQLGATSTNDGADGGFAMGERGRITSYMLPTTGTDADELLARAQQHIAGRNKRAIDGAVRHTANSFSKYFANELQETVEREWWSHEADTYDE